jgi:hypothetical protein
MSDKLHKDLALEFLAHQIAKRLTIEVCDFHEPFSHFMNEYHKGFIWCDSRTDKVVSIFHEVVLPHFKKQLQLNKPQGSKFTKYINKFIQG